MEDSEIILRKRTQRILSLIRKLRGEKAASYWAWNMTPMPFWFPSKRQLWSGVLFALRLDRLANRLAGPLE